MARSLESYVSGLIAGLQPSKSDFRSFSKLLQGQFLLQIKLCKGPNCQNSISKLRKANLSLQCRKNGFGLDASDWENCALRTAPASLQNFWQIQTGRHSAFCVSWELLGPSWGPPTIGQKMARSLESYVSGLIAGLQPSKSDFRSFSNLLPSQMLLQIKLFRGPKLPKQHFKAQTNKIELKMSKKRLRARRVRLGKLCFENGSCLPAVFLGKFKQGGTVRFAFRGSFWGCPGVHTTIGQKMARSLESYVSGLVAGLHP